MSTSIPDPRNTAAAAQDQAAALEHIADSGDALMACLMSLLTDPTTAKADLFRSQQRALDTQVRRLRQSLAECGAP